MASTGLLSHALGGRIHVTPANYPVTARPGREASDSRGLIQSWGNAWTDHSVRDDDLQCAANDEHGGGSHDRFEDLRRQFEHRRQAQAEENERAMAEVDIEEFQHDPLQKVGEQSIDFEVIGAIPPTTDLRGADVAASTAIVRSEKEAARELLRVRQEAEATRIKENAEAIRRAEKPGGISPEAFDRQPSLERSSSSSCMNPFVDTAGGAVGEIVHAKSALSPKDTLHSPMKTWETRITEFYGKWEAHRDREQAVMAQIKDEQELAERTQQVREHHFELNHRYREAKITEQRHRKDKHAAQRKYEDMVEVQLAMNDIFRKQQLAECKEHVFSDRDRAAAAKAARKKALTFVSQGTLIEKTCRHIDTQKVRADERAKACEYVADLQEKWTAKSARARGRRALQEAQQRVRDASHRGRVLYMAKGARDRQENREEEVRQRISAERGFKSCVRLARKGLETHEHLYKAESTDLQRYEDSLACLRELAEAVQEHHRQISGVTSEAGAQHHVGDLPPQLGPLSAAEPRVRAMFGLSATPEDDFGGSETETPTADAGSATVGLDKTLPTSPLTKTSTKPSRHSPHALTESTVASPSPVPPSRPRSQMAMSPLVVRPLQAICQQQFDGSRARTPNKAARKDLQSLAVLRKIRQTGPLIKR